MEYFQFLVHRCLFSVRNSERLLFLRLHCSHHWQIHAKHFKNKSELISKGIVLLETNRRISRFYGTFYLNHSCHFWMLHMVLCWWTQRSRRWLRNNGWISNGNLTLQLQFDFDGNSDGIHQSRSWHAFHSKSSSSCEKK